MSGWNIDVGQSVAVMRAAMAKVEGVEPAVKGILKALADAEAAIPGGVVVDGLADVLARRLEPDISEVLSRSGTIFDSTARALSYYQSGDLEMAAVAQRSAARAGVPGRPRPLVD